MAWVFQTSKQVKKLGSAAPWYVGWFDPGGKKRCKSCGPGATGEAIADWLRSLIELELSSPVGPLAPRPTYLFQAPEGGNTKVGDSKNIPARRKHLSLGSPSGLVHIASTMFFEAWIKQRFAHLRHRPETREWFVPAPELLIWMILRATPTNKGVDLFEQLFALKPVERLGSSSFFVTNLGVGFE